MEHRPILFSLFTFNPFQQRVAGLYHDFSVCRLSTIDQRKSEARFVKYTDLSLVAESAVRLAATDYGPMTTDAMNSRPYIF